MGHYRRHVLAATSLSLFSGCLLDFEEDRPPIQLFNHDAEPHDLWAGFRGSDDDEPIQEVTASLEPDSETVVDERLDLDRYEGRELVVEARFDGGEATENRIAWGFVELHVAITDDETISLGGPVP